MIESFIVAAIILLTGLTGFFLRLLTVSGAAAAVITGLAIFSGFGIRGLMVLGIFFATSSFWSRFKSISKKAMEDKLAKGAVRDWRQVAANGGFAALLGLAEAFDHNPLWLIGFFVCMASANSDTWASEIGPLSQTNPISVRSFRRVEKGTSGAISLLGTVAALLGSFLIAGVVFILFNTGPGKAVVIFLFGFAGNIIDTLAGAFTQKVYRCRGCGTETEKKIHCRVPAMKIKGFSFMDNDMVNFLSGFIAALGAIVTVSL